MDPRLAALIEELKPPPADGEVTRPDDPRTPMDPRLAALIEELKPPPTGGTGR